MRADTVSLREASRLLDTPHSTVQMWCEVGIIDSEGMPNGKRVILLSSVMLMKHGLQDAEFRIEAEGMKESAKMIERAFARWRVGGNIQTLTRDIMAVQRTVEKLRRKRGVA